MASTWVWISRDQPQASGFGQFQGPSSVDSLCAAHPCSASRPERRPARPVRLPPHRRQPDPVHLRLLQEFYETIPEDRIEGIRVTGSGSRAIAKVLGLFFENEFKAIARTIGTLYPQVRTVFEIGGEAPSISDWKAPASWITTAPASAPPAPAPSSISRRCACSTP